jgi:hypothetical protein
MPRIFKSSFDPATEAALDAVSAADVEGNRPGEFAGLWLAQFAQPTLLAASSKGLVGAQLYDLCHGAVPVARTAQTAARTKTLDDVTAAIAVAVPVAQPAPDPIPDQPADAGAGLIAKVGP